MVEFHCITIIVAVVVVVVVVVIIIIIIILIIIFIRLLNNNTVIMYGCITNSNCDQLPVGFIAQLAEHCTSIAQFMGLNPVQPEFFQALISQLLKLCVCNAAMINHVFKSFFTLQIYGLSQVQLHYY